MEDEGCRRDAELSSATDAADPLDDEIDVEREIAGPVPIRTAGAELDRPDVTVVPEKAIEVGFVEDHCHVTEPVVAPSGGR